MSHIQEQEFKPRGMCSPSQSRAAQSGYGVPSQEQQTDGFARDFDSLISRDDAAETMGQLALVTTRDDPFGVDLKLDHTRDHFECPACRQANKALLLTGADLAAMPFDDAKTAWCLLRRQSAGLRERTHEATLGYLNSMGVFFGRMRLCDITPGHVRAYQIARKRNTLRIEGTDRHPWPDPVGNSYINHEIATLGLMMKFASLWHRIKPYYSPLPVPKWSPRDVLTVEQEEALFKHLPKKPEAALAYWVAAITNNTTASGMELRGLRLKHLFLTDVIAEIYIPEDSVKNDSRPRKIALNNKARWAVGECLKRAIRLGATDPEHFLFPFRLKRNVYDPTRQASPFFLRKSWAKLQAATGFVNLRPHDLRHQCITSMLENGVQPETVTAIAGHVGRKMLEYYSHHRKQVKYAAVMTLEAKKPPARETAPKRVNRRGSAQREVGIA
jgi:integrase